MKILFIGDIVGKLGRQAIASRLPGLKKEKQIDLVIANGENASHGFGLIQKNYEELKGYGIDLITLGNHAWDKKETLTYVNEVDGLLRPLNLPPGTPGQGAVVLEKNGFQIGVMTLIGRVFMADADCPFRAAERQLERFKKNCSVIFVEMHCEATSEKKAMGYFLGGKVSAVLGSHTHTQTADEQLLEGTTAFLTDAGMTGPFDSVLGIKKEIIIKRFVDGLPSKFEVVEEGPALFSAALVEVDENTGRALSIERIYEVITP